VPVDQHTIELDGQPVHFRTAPPAAAAAPGAATAVYLHGAPSSSADFIPFLERGGGIAVDLQGFGRSGKGGHLEYSLDALAGVVERLLDARELERVAVVGHQWGGAVAVVLARRSPERVQRLALIDPVPLLPGVRLPRLARVLRTAGLGELALGAVGRPVLARILRRGAVTAGAWTQQRLDEVWSEFDQGTQRALLRVHRASGEDELAAAGGHGLASVQAPVLILWGEHDPWLDPSYAEAYARALPAATAEVVAAAGHWPWLDRPEVIERVVEFLAAGT
jgi:pimeloyl-ACP methyl ester carboxylesterase